MMQTNVQTDLVTAIRNGRFGEIKRLVESGVDLNVRDAYNSTALLYACHHVQVFKSREMADIVRMLLDRGADPLVRDSFGRTPLGELAYYGYTELVKRLLDMGADLNDQDDQGLTALMQASRGQNTEIINELLKRGADPEIKDNKGRTAKMLDEIWR